MIYKEIPIQAEGSAEDARLVVYILDTPEEKIKIQKRPVMILCPGGGYERTSYREGEPLAMHFLNRGYHVGVLRYSTAPAVFPTALMELGMAVKLFHTYEREWKVDTEHIIVQGSSAGGHLAASLGVFWNQPFLWEALQVPAEMLKPKGLILSYPVISSDEEKAHTASFKNLLGDAYASQEKKELVSLERQVGVHTPPCFIWHTFTDQTVPVGNSLRMALALERYKIPTELHIFREGIHGLGTATKLVEKPDGAGVQAECQCWVDLADAWLAGLCKDAQIY